MAIKVHGHPLSPPTRTVLLTLAEKDIDYEFVQVDLSTGQHKKDTFLSLNPFGQIPAFEDGDLKLFESRAISKYISYAYGDKGTPLLAQDPKNLAIIGVWSEVEAHRFDAAGSKISFEIVIKPVLGLTTDEAVVEQSEAQLAAILDVYEKRLAESKYLGGDDYSLADLIHVPIIYNLFKTKAKALFEQRPHVSSWSADLLARPTWQKVLAKIESYDV